MCTYETKSLAVSSIYSTCCMHLILMRLHLCTGHMTAYDESGGDRAVSIFKANWDPSSEQLLTSEPTASNNSVAHLLAEAREQTDKLFSIIREDFLYERPVSERHRLIFYLGHLEAFDWNQLGRFHLSLPSFHPTFDKLFEFGIDP